MLTKLATKFLAEQSCLLKATFPALQRISRCLFLSYLLSVELSASLRRRLARRGVGGAFVFSGWRRVSDDGGLESAQVLLRNDAGSFS